MRVSIIRRETRKLVRHQSNTSFVRTGPTPIFKKRFERFNTVIGSQVNATVQTLTFRETGTVYAVKIDAKAQHIGGAVGDIQNCELYCFVQRSGGGTPDLSLDPVVETLNGFFMGSLLAADGDNTVGSPTMLRDKFRYRRKVDENMELRIAARNAAIAGTGRSVAVFGNVEVIIRVR